MGYSIKRSGIFATLVMMSLAASAQRNFGIATGNTSALNAMYLNPALIAECRESKAVTLLGFSLGVDNNVGPFNAGKGLVVAVGDGKSNNMFTYSRNSRVSMHAPYLDITGPGVLFKVDDKHSIAFTTRLRGMNQFNNFDQTVFHTFNDPKFRVSDNILTQPKDFVYTVHMWGEFGFTYGGVFYDDGVHKIKAGGTVRYLGGIAYVGMHGKQMDANFTAGKDTFLVSNADLAYSSNILNTQVGQGKNVSQSFFSLLYKGRYGHGLGADFGVVYEYKPTEEVLERNIPEEKKTRDKLAKKKKFTLAPKREKEAYRLRLNAAICEIGTVHYSKGNNTTEYIKGSGSITGPALLDRVTNMANLKTYAQKQGFTADIRQEAASVTMPMHLVLGGDYHIKDHYYTNLTILMNLASRKRYGNSYYNQFTITPRYEMKSVSLGLPITYSTLTNRFKAGLGLYAGGFFIGSDDMLAFFSNSAYGINFYAGLNVQMYK